MPTKKEDNSKIIFLTYYKTKSFFRIIPIPVKEEKLHRVRNRKPFSAFSSSGFDNFTSVCSGHSFSKTVFVSSFSVRWLKRSFTHFFYFFASAKIYLFLFPTKYIFK